MAKLPPKIPNIVSQGQHNNHHTQWLELNHDSLNLAQHPHQHQPWVYEFMEFSAAKRNAHRRTVSDSSVAFIEAGPVPFLAPFRCPDTSNGLKKSDDHFDKFDDDQFMSMFSNDIGGSSSNPSSTSDHNSTNEDQKRKGGAAQAEGRGSVRDGDAVVRVAAATVKNEAEEVESSCKYDKEGEGQGQGQHGDVGSKDGNTNGESGDCNAGGNSEQQQVVDPKRFKRILANRQSAQRSRVRKLQYISELERSVTALQSEVSVLSPRVAFLDHQRMILNVDNSALKAKIAALAQDKIFKDAHQEALKREIERLRQVYYQQSIKKTEGMVTPPSSSPLPSTTPQPQQPDTIVNEHEQQLTG